VCGEGVSTRENENKNGKANHKLKKSRLVNTTLQMTKYEWN
jgi:hypothetical protein